MPIRHRLLAVLVALIWGINFVAIHASLSQFPPFLLAAIRFTLIAVPTIVLVPRPRVPLRWLLGYGLGFGTLQFLFLYWGMAAGMPAGLASLVLQASAPFTVVLGAALLRERVGRRAAIGTLVAMAGLVVVGWERAGGAALIPFLLTLAGALGWAIGNICSRRAGASEPLHFTLWMSVVPPLPMFALSLVTEGPGRIVRSLAGALSMDAIGALAGLAYTVVLATVVGSGIWTWLLARHPAGVVSPFSMLVPGFGIVASWIVLGERVTAAELVGAAFVVAGVVFGSARSVRHGRCRRVGLIRPRNGRVPVDQLRDGRHGSMEKRKHDSDGRDPGHHRPADLHVPVVKETDGGHDRPYARDEEQHRRDNAWNVVSEPDAQRNMDEDEVQGDPQKHRQPEEVPAEYRGDHADECEEHELDGDSGCKGRDGVVSDVAEPERLVSGPGPVDLGPIFAAPRPRHDDFFEIMDHEQRRL